MIIAKDTLELLVARAKHTGDQLWYQLKHSFAVFEAGTGTNHEDLRANSYNIFADMCEAFGENFPDKELGELLALEMFLRAGKHMEHDVKVTNRKRADALTELILRRKIDDPSSAAR